MAQPLPRLYVVVGTVLAMARAEVAHSHGQVPGGRFAIIGYGSLGGAELGFGSDLDLVFLHDQPAGCEGSDGKRPLDPGRYYARLAQKVITLLGAVTAGGRLYDIDVRLRPDGGKGALVSSLASYSEYQRERAWTWEHQALVRARGVAGDASLLADFQAVRADTLGRRREAATVLADVNKMRARMRAELDRSDAARLDLKQGQGAVVDLEFALQAGVLLCGAQSPAVLASANTVALIDALQAAGWWRADEADSLHAAHRLLLDLGLACTLDRRKRMAPYSEAVMQAQAAITAACQRCGLDFQAPVEA